MGIVGFHLRRLWKMVLVVVVVGASELRYPMDDAYVLR
jgi:hypothetical protein